MGADFRVIVCGSRDYSNGRVVAKTLKQVLADHPRMIVIEGGASGADRLARLFAAHTKTPNATYPADWKRNGKRAGPLRNQRMLDAGADLVVAFPGGRGTADMVSRAKRAGVRVIEIEEADNAPSP